MKKHMIALIMVLTLFMAALPMQALAYPYIDLDTYACTPAIQQGGTGKIVVNLWPSYNRERCVVVVVNSNGEFVNEVSQVVTNTNFDDKRITLTINAGSMNLQPGTYRARVRMEYYDQESWRQTPQDVLTHEFEVVSSACGDAHKLVKTATEYPATCTSTGLDKYTCSVCKYITYKDVAKLEHKYGLDYYKVYPSQTMAGEAVYRCNGCGKEEIRVIPISSVVRIQTQPLDVTVSAEKKATFTVVATGDGLKYQWYYRNNKDDSWKKLTSTKASYSVYNSMALDGRQFICEVRDQYDVVEWSRVATLKLPVVKITAQPKSTWVYNGQIARVSVKATGDGLKYQWYGSLDNGKTWGKTSCTKATYSLQMNKDRNGRMVKCVVTDAYGRKKESNAVTLSTRFKAKIIAQPKNVLGKSGERVTVSIKASGDDITYQWYIANPGSSTFKKSSGTSAKCTMVMDKARDGRKMYCVVTDKYGHQVKSNTITVSMKRSMKITSQPAAQTKKTGERASFKVKATGDGLKYRWYYRESGSAKWIGTSCTKDTYSITAKKNYHGRRYYCLVTDAYGNKIKSKEAVLKVTK